ncbi:MAG: hypothetical protein ACLPYB_03630 [Desulfobaccales bacterium]
MNLKDILRKYSPGNPRLLHELKWFREQPDLKATIECAALAINCKGERCPHQRRLKKVDLEHAKDALLKRLEEIKKVKSFDDLFLLIQGLLKDIKGIGELYIYDTSLRIGARLDLFPTKVYLHAGTRVGAQALLGLAIKNESIEVSELTKELQKLKPYEIEDFLCIYRECLNATGLKHAKCLVTKRSRCD